MQCFDDDPRGWDDYFLRLRDCLEETCAHFFSPDLPLCASPTTKKTSQGTPSMHTIADFCVIPMGVTSSVSEYIAECQRVIEKSGKTVVIFLVPPHAPHSAETCSRRIVVSPLGFSSPSKVD